MIINFLTTILIYAILLIAFAGFGRLFGRRGGFFTSCLYGWAGVTIGLNMVHFVTALNAFVLALFITVGLITAVIALSRGELLFSQVSLLIAFATAICVTFLALTPSPIYDDGLYHFQVVAWYSEYSAVPGLANLHGRFGFNSSYYLYAAMLDSLPGNAIRYAAPLLIIIFGGYVGEQVGATRRLALWMVISLLSVHPGISLSNDVPALLVVSFLLCEAWIFLEHKQRGIAGLAMLASAALAIKTSTLVFSAGIFALCWVISSPRNMRAVAIYGLAFVIVAAHGVVLSGYPLYPVPLLALPLDWTVPLDNVRLEMQWIISWARWPGASFEQTLESTTWIGPWITALLFIPGSTIPLALIAVSPLLARMSGVRSRHWLLLLPTLAGIIYWLVTAPAVRFGISVFWAGASVSIVLATARKPIINRVIYAAVFLRMGTVFITTLMQQTPVRETVALERYVLENGQELYVPADGDQCWHAPLPCAPSRGDVTLRTADMASGFKPSPGILTENTGEAP